MFPPDEDTEQPASGETGDNGQPPEEESASDENLDDVEPETGEDESVGSDDTDERNYLHSFKDRPAAEKGYKELQGRATRAEQENASLKKQIADIERERMMAGWKNRMDSIENKYRQQEAPKTTEDGAADNEKVPLHVKKFVGDEEAFWAERREKEEVFKDFRRDVVGKALTEYDSEHEMSDDEEFQEARAEIMDSDWFKRYERQIHCDNFLKRDSEKFFKEVVELASNKTMAKLYGKRVRSAATTGRREGKTEGLKKSRLAVEGSGNRDKSGGRADNIKERLRAIRV